MIVGGGIELVELARFEALLDRYGDRLRTRLFTEREREFADGPARSAESLAVRFAAKVAARRALGGGAFRWRDIEVVRSRSGAPQLRFEGLAARAAQRADVQNIAVSLSHDARWCVGQVVLESAP